MTKDTWRIFAMLVALMLLLSCRSFSDEELRNEVALIKSELKYSENRKSIIMLGANCYCASELITYDIKINEMVHTVRPRYVTIVDKSALNVDSFFIDWRDDPGARNFHPIWKPFEVVVGSDTLVFLYFLDGKIKQLEVDDGFKEFAKIRLTRRALDCTVKLTN